MSQSDRRDGVLAAWKPFVLKKEAVLPWWDQALLGVLHLFVHLGIVTISMGHYVIFPFFLITVASCLIAQYGSHNWKIYMVCDKMR